MDSPKFTQLSTSQQIQNPMLQTILILIVVAVFGWFVLGPKYTKTTATRATLAEVEAQRANLEADQQELNKLISKMEDSQDEVKLVDEAVPLTGRPTKIALLLETYAQNAGMTISQLGIAKPEEFIASGNKQELDKPFQGNRDLATIDVNVTAVGSIDQFKNFLILLEQSGRLIDVDTLTVNNGDTSESFSLKLKTYAYELAELPAPKPGKAQ